ncbi:MAG: SLC13 family permease [Vicinamibacterales bacterium]
MALEACGLHRRLALTVLAVVGPQPARLVLGFMVTTAFISLWVNNSATVVMMLPMATSVMALARDRPARSGRGRAARVRHNRAVCWASPTPAISAGWGLYRHAAQHPLAGFMSETYGVRIGFVEWMLGVPIVVAALPFSVAACSRWLHPVGVRPIAGGAAMLSAERRALGPLSQAEWTVGLITALTAAAWVSRPLLGRWVPALTDAGIAITGAALLFVVPLGWRPLRAALTWAQAERLPWSVLILFGGGLSLAAAIQATGLATWIGGALGALAGWPRCWRSVLVVACGDLPHRAHEQHGDGGAFLPIVASLAVGVGADHAAAGGTDRPGCQLRLRAGGDACQRHRLRIGTHHPQVAGPACSWTCSSRRCCRRSSVRRVGLCRVRVTPGGGLAAATPPTP